jgi:hypothetical protein
MRKSWRDVLPVHPAAGRIPEATAEEKRALAADLARHGLKVPVVLAPVPGEPGRRCLLDGRTRLDLLEAAGKQVVDARGRLLVEHKVARPKDEAEAERLSLSLNVHRRHLTAEQKRDLIANLIKAAPEKSDRAIAEMAKASPTSVGKVRRATVHHGQLLDKRVGKDGKARKQPAKKQPKVAEAPAEKQVEAINEIERLSPDPNPNRISRAWIRATQKQRLEFALTYHDIIHGMAAAEQRRTANRTTPRSPRPLPRSVVKAIADRAEDRSKAGR